MSKVAVVYHSGYGQLFTFAMQRGMIWNRFD